MRKISIGKSSFSKIIKENDFYIDKTLFIKDYLEKSSEVTLITRPRRFGKSMNLDMLEHFLSINKDKEETKKLFEDLNLSNHHDFINKHMNKYPIIRIDMKDVDGLDYNTFVKSFMKKIRNLFERYEKRIDKGKVSEPDFKILKDIVNYDFDATIAEDSLRLLLKLMFETYDKRVIILIDEYDMPLEKAYANGYYKEANSVYGTFLSSALKGDEHLEKALLIGCSKVAQAGIFSGLNNPSIHSIYSDDDFNSYFGFTENEVKEALKEYELEDTFNDVKFWYDGYNFNETTIYNPWSFTNYLKKRKFGYYWVNTGSLRHIRESVFKLKDYKKLFVDLIQEEKVIGTYTDFISYSKDTLSKNDILSLLYQAGYLNMENNEFKPVNYETKVSLKEEFVGLLEEKATIPDAYGEFLTNLTDFNIPSAISNYEEMLNDIIYTDPEATHQAILMITSHYIKNNYTATREGLNTAGRSDLVIKSLDRKSGFIIEVKRIGEDNKITLGELVIDALTQIKSRNYASVLKRENYERIHHVALAIKGANVSIKLEKKDYPEYKDIQEYLIQLK